MSGIWGENENEDIWGRPKPKMQRAQQAPRVVYIRREPIRQQHPIVIKYVVAGTKKKRVKKQNDVAKIKQYAEAGRKVFFPSAQERIQSIRDKNRAIIRQEVEQETLGRERKMNEELRARQRVNNPTIGDKIGGIIDRLRTKKKVYDN